MRDRVRRLLSPWTIAAAVLVTIAVALRVHNSIVYPVPRGYDSFGHVIYIWYLLKTGRIPLANEGWSLFHPPLYFALSAAMWRAWQHMDPIRVMHLISLVFALLGMVPAWISYLIVRRYFGSNQRLLLLLAPAFVLFLPVCIYTAPMMGNEGLHAVLCSLIIYCLIRTVTDWNLRWAAALGVALGLAFLTKFTASGMIFASTVVMAAIGWRRGARRRAIKMLAVTLSIAFLISGWFYIRNIMIFGNPFQMSRDFFFVQRIENAQAGGVRTLHDYISFDTSIFSTPSMLRPGFFGAITVRSVWTGVFANTWFDAFGGWFLPSTLSNPLLSRFGQLILRLAIVPTLLCILGFAATVWRLIRGGWDDTLVSLLVVFAVTAGMYVQFTRSVPMYSALKASYLLPVTVVFSFWFALGVSIVARSLWLRRALIIELALLVAAIIPVFSYGVLFEIQPGAQDQNARGVVCYLAGFRDRAETLFEAAATDHSYLAHENLATIALEENDPYRALAEILRAEALMPLQVIGNAFDRQSHTRSLMSEYQNTRAYIYAQLGWNDLALRTTREAIDLDPNLPEPYYNRALLLVKAGRTEQAAQTLSPALDLDPNFVEAQALLGSVSPQDIDCGSATPVLEAALKGVRLRRSFPVETGRGDITDAGIGRRKLIPDTAAGERPGRTLALCRASSGEPAQSARVSRAPARSQAEGLDGSTSDSSLEAVEAESLPEAQPKALQESDEQ